MAGRCISSARRYEPRNFTDLLQPAFASLRDAQSVSVREVALALAHLRLVKPFQAEVEDIPAKPYSVIRLVGAFGFYACLLLMTFCVVGLHDLRLAGLSVAGAAAFGFVWLFGAIEMRLIMVEQALNKISPG